MFILFSLCLHIMYIFYISYDILVKSYYIMSVVVDVMIIFCTANYQYIATIIRRTLFKIKETFEIICSNNIMYRIETVNYNCKSLLLYEYKVRK